MNPTNSSRRALLKSAAAAALIAPLGIAAAQAAEPSAQKPSDPWRGLKAGMASYSFRKLPLEACIKGIRRVDMKYVSIKDFHLSLKSSHEERKEVAQKFRDAGITPLSCGVISLKNNEAAWRNAFEYARDIGVPTIVCMPSADALPLLDKLVKEYDIRMAIHNHGPEAGTWKAPSDVWSAIQSVDPRIGLCIDVGHTARAGADPVESIRAYKARLYDVHMKDINNPHGRNAGASEVEVGRGILDVPGMFRALLEIGYAHHVGFEHEKDANDPIPGVAESVGYAKGVVRMIGT